MEMNSRCDNIVYFTALLCDDERLERALELMVADLRADQDLTIGKLFNRETESLDIISALIRHVGSPNTRIAGNAAYILGMVAEAPVGLQHVMSVVTKSDCPERPSLLRNLTNLFACSDRESIMNSAGAIGTLADNAEGCLWMLADPCINETITCLIHLLQNECHMTASNAALILARLTMADDGCAMLLNHKLVDELLSSLIDSLGDDVAGLGRNAAFAVGRICDKDEGRRKLLRLSAADKIVSSLVVMLRSHDASSCKSACFALCCLASSPDGHARVLIDGSCRDMISILVQLLCACDDENRWFAAMTIRKFVQVFGGRLIVQEHGRVYEALLATLTVSDVTEDLRDEVTSALSFLAPLARPLPPSVEIVSASELCVKWIKQVIPFNEPVTYKLFEGSNGCVYEGSATVYSLRDLTPNTEYRLQVQAVVAAGEQSPLSEGTVAVTAMQAVPATEQSVVRPPTGLSLLTRHATQLRVGWQAPPLDQAELVRFYSVYFGTELREQTIELHSILSGLSPSTVYEVSVRAVTSIGKSHKVTLSCTTADIGDHAPSKPELIVRGRCELCVTWHPPLVPLGRITRYDLSVDGCVVYSGTDLRYNICRLKPGTEYNLSVCVITSDGRCESKPTKKKTAKDEFDVQRVPLYQTSPSRKYSKSNSTTGDLKSLHKPRKSLPEALIRPSHQRVLMHPSVSKLKLPKKKKVPTATLR